MKDVFDGTASPRASDPPTAIGAQKLVFISDCHGTLVSPPNKELFNTLIKAKEAGHTVIITSTRYDLRSVTTLMLKNAGMPENYFNIKADGEDLAVVLKKNLSRTLDQLGIKKADFVFEDKSPLEYLRSEQIGSHVNPEDFFLREAPSGDYLRMRMALAAPAP